MSVDKELDEYTNRGSEVHVDSVRDAALAAIDAVRAIHAPEVVGIHEGYGEEVWCPTCEHNYPCPTVAVLDGAPEPDKYEKSIRSAERERIIAILESLKGTCSGDCDDCRPYAQINDNYLTQVIALIKGGETL